MCRQHSTQIKFNKVRFQGVALNLGAVAWKIKNLTQTIYKYYISR